MVSRGQLNGNSSTSSECMLNIAPEGVFRCFCISFHKSSPSLPRQSMTRTLKIALKWKTPALRRWKEEEEEKKKGGESASVDRE